MYLDNSTRVICCEPFEKNLSLLRENFRLNNFTKRVQYISEPISDEVSFSDVSISDDRIGASGFKLIKNQNITSQVKTINIDSLNGISDNFILKIDTDGHDFEILKGTKNYLENNLVDSVLIETNANQQKDIEQFLVQFKLIPDARFNLLPDHSSSRRISAGKLERNIVYTKGNLIT